MTGPTLYTLNEVASRDGKDGADTWIVIHDLVYDVTKYKAKHPGGPELIDEYAGADATSGFDDFGHSSEATRMLKDYLIGELVDADKKRNRKKRSSSSNGTKTKAAKNRKRIILSALCGNCAA